MYTTENKISRATCSSTTDGHGRQPFFQPKLTVNKPGDRYEQEADAMADKVMRMQMPAGQGFFKANETGIQRKCKDCEDEHKMLSRKEGDTTDTKSNGGLDSYVSSLGSSGQPLSAATRQFFEPRFGHDFSNVRIHTDGVAAKSAQSINALAYTTGNNIVFNQGQFSPGSESGQRLMAHELTHVIQQGGGAAADTVSRTCSDGVCKDCAGGKKDFWMTFYFRRKATAKTMETIRKEINDTKSILEKCCLTLKCDFNWDMVAGDSKSDFLDTSDPAKNRLSDDAKKLGTGKTFSKSKGLPVLVVDDVPHSGGGITITKGFDPAYTDKTYLALAVNQGRPNNGCTHLAHELWHVGGHLNHNKASGGTLADCTGNAINPEFCTGIRTFARA